MVGQPAVKAMHASDARYCRIANGVLVVSGTGPALRVEDNRLVVRDGPKETPPLILTRAEASRRLHHVVVTGDYGGYVTFDALRFLRDTSVSFSQLDWTGAVIIASGPRGPDQPALRRAQALATENAVGLAVTKELLHVKLRGQSEVARMLGCTDAAAMISSLADKLSDVSHGAHLLSIEATSAVAYWKIWGTLPVHFARRNPDRLINGKWRAGRRDDWTIFGTRASELTGKNYRASTPGNALLNFLYGVLHAEMTVALYSVGLDPGIAIFHADRNGRASLSYDAMEPIRFYVDAWLATFLKTSIFANRDFEETPQGEIRLTHPLRSHLASTAAIWRKPAETVAAWLATALLSPSSPIDGTPGRDGGGREIERRLPVLPALPMLRSTPANLETGSIPRTCQECGKALSARKRKFCDDDCAISWHGGAPQRRSIAAIHEGRLNHSSQAATKRSATVAANRAPERAWRTRPGWSPAGDDALRAWYLSILRPAIADCRPADIRDAMGASLPAAINVRDGKLLPHPRHFAALAALAGVAGPPG